MNIIPKIEEFLISRPDDERADGCFHPSELSKCPRIIYESFLKLIPKEEKIPVVERIFDNGKDVHLRIQAYLKLCGILLSSEVELYNEEFNICGSADGIIELGGVLGVVEIKSINLNQFITLFTPKKSHVEQLNIYMYCLMQCYPVDATKYKSDQFNNLDWGIILYECKDNQRMKEFFISYDHSIMSSILAKIDYVRTCILTNKIPPRINHEDCRWCKKTDCL